MIPIVSILLFTIQAHFESNGNRSIPQKSPSLVFTESTKAPSFMFSSTAGNAPAKDYSRPEMLSRLHHHSVTQTLDGNAEEKKKTLETYAVMEKYFER